MSRISYRDSRKREHSDQYCAVVRPLITAGTGSRKSLITAKRLRDCLAALRRGDVAVCPVQTLARLGGRNSVTRAVAVRLELEGS